MSLSLPAVLGVGFLLGLRHAFEPDHLAAVSTLATRQRRVRDAAGLGIAWGLGHTVSVALVALAVMALGVQVPERFGLVGDLVVAALLVLLGGTVLTRYARGRWHMHRHTHDGGPHLHLHSHSHGPSHEHRHANWDVRRALGFGLAHGMAGSAAVLVLVVASATTSATQAAYIVAFGAGTIAGMLAVSLVLGALVRVASNKGEKLAVALHVSSALVSIVVGVVLAIKLVLSWGRESLSG